MKILKLFILPALILLLINLVNAVTVDVTWSNNQNSITINNGEQASFNYGIFSTNPPIKYSIKIYDNTGNLIKTFIEISSNNYLISGNQAITQSDYGTSGRYNIEVQAIDNLEDVSLKILSLQVNPSPGIINNAPVLNQIGNQQIIEGKLLQFNVVATDIDNDVLTLSVTGLPSGSSFVDNKDGTGLFTWTPGFDQAGTYKLRFIASDNLLSDYEDIIIDVYDSSYKGITKKYKIAEEEKVSYPPILSIINPKENEIISGDYNIRWIANDINQNSLTLDVKIEYREDGFLNNIASNLENLIGMSLGPRWIVLENLNDNNDGIFLLNTRLIDNGDYQLRISVKDDENNLVSLSVNFAIDNFLIINNDPVITSIPVLNATVNELYNYDVEAYDLNNDILTYILVYAPIGMNINANTGLITWIPNSTGNYSVDLFVLDNKGGFAEQNFVINVNEKEIPVVEKITEKHRFKISNVIIKQIGNNLNIFIDLDNKGSKESIQLIITDLTSGKRVYEKLSLNKNNGILKTIDLKNPEKGMHVIKVEAISRYFKDTKYSYIYI